MADVHENANNETENGENEDVGDRQEEEMEESDSSSSDDDSVDAEVHENIKQLKEKICEDPYMYDNHVELIKLQREVGELDGLRLAREKMSELFPMSEDLWLEWLKDETKLATEEEGRENVEKLFNRAVKDYLSVPIWLEYAQYSIGGMGMKDGINKVREVFEKSLTAAGLHVSKGNDLWEAYREFENAILAGLLPAPGSVATKELEDEFSAQHDRVAALFKRQLSVPLFDMEETFDEYKEWLQDDMDAFTKLQYKKAKERVEQLKPYEEALISSEPPHLEDYEKYIEFEMSQKDPARIQCIFERALQENCLIPKLWIQYTKYLDSLKVKQVSLSVYERAVRNCPWCVQLWQSYILALERFQEDYEQVKAIFERGLTSGFSLGSEYLQLWTTFVDYLRRRIKWEEDHEKDLETFRLTMQKAVEHVDSFGVEGDANGTLRQFWAVIEGKHCKRMDRARELWSEILVSGKANEAAIWMEYYRLERSYGDNKHCRKVLQRALNSVTDWPESIVDAYINFEREEGNLEQYDQAVAKCEAQMQRINERREKNKEKTRLKTGVQSEICAAEKESAMEAQQKPSKKGDKKGQKKWEKKQGGKQFQGKYVKDEPHRTKDHNKPAQQTQKRKLEDIDEKPKTEMSDGFKVPTPPKMPKMSPPPGFKGPKSEPPPGFKGPKSEPPPGFKGPKSEPPPGFKGQKSEPPPGFKGQKTERPPGFKEKATGHIGAGDADEPLAKKQKTEEKAHEGLTHKGDKDSRTVFVSNLAYAVDEEKLKDIFCKCGQVTEVRLIKNYKGQSKGYAYVEFVDEFPVSSALSMDREQIEGRPMYVSRCEDRSKRKQPEFRFSTDLEKNKLFIKGLPFTCSKEALEKIFGAHGELQSVRLVTYRSGASKGIAYVEYKEEQDAAQAVLKTDGLMIGEHTISVAISNPPVRKTPFAKRDESEFVPTLGGGKKETETRGTARTQVMLFPRALKHKPSPAGGAAVVGAAQAVKETVTTSAESSGNASVPKTSMSNDDFRSMLLKK